MARPEDVVVDELDRVMNDFVDRVFQLSQENLTEPHDKTFKSGKTRNVITTDTGALLRSGNVIRQKLAKKIIYSAPYADSIEFGSTTENVIPQDLEKWVRRKVLKNKGTPAQVAASSKNIANSLKRRGISPDPFLGPAISKARQEFKV